MLLLGVLAAQAEEAPVSAGSDMDLLAYYVPGGTVGSVVFDNLDNFNNYRYLQLHYKAKSNTAGVYQMDLNMRFNADTGTNYFSSYSGSSASSADTLDNNNGSQAKIGQIKGNFADTDHTTGFVTLANPFDTNWGKTWEFYGSGPNRASARYHHGVGWWDDTSALTSIEIEPQTGSFVANSRFSLYGLGKVS